LAQAGSKFHLPGHSCHAILDENKHMAGEGSTSDVLVAVLASATAAGCHLRPLWEDPAAAACPTARRTLGGVKVHHDGG
jgi:hypothetical protein